MIYNYESDPPLHISLMAKGDLKRHMKSFHDGVKYSCKYCDYKVIEKGNLQQHAQSINDGVTYSCEYCDYKAT